MECQTREIANVLLVQIAGRVDHTTSKALEEQLLPQLDTYAGEEKKVLLDLSEVVYMSSAGLRVLTMAAKRCRKQHSDVVVSGLPPLLEEVFRISRFDTVFKIYKTVGEALEEISPVAASTYQSC